MKIKSRPRRNRKNPQLRQMVRENNLSVSDLIAPLFVIEGSNQKIEVASMPGQFRFSKDLLIEEIKRLQDLGIPCVSLFPVIDDQLKNSTGSESTNANGLYPGVIEAVKKAVPNILLMTDVALDPYSSDGHDGVVDATTGEILNDQSLEILAAMAVTQANAGSDIIGPSDMMDGRIGVIRDALDQNGHINTSIMSYTAKYASSFYGPFRDALDSAPKSGDKKTYQMDFANKVEALREAKLDQAEGADILMVKPGLAYLDVISELKRNFQLPIAAYNVSGEYAMVKAAAQKGWIDNDGIILETLTSFKRAGADMILTYFAAEAALLLS